MLFLFVFLLATPAHAQRSDDDESALLVGEARADIGDKRYDAAAAKLDRALSLNPRRIDAYVLRGGVHAAKKQFRDGVTLLRRAFTLAPDNLDVLTALGTQLMLAGDVAEGVPLLEKVIARAPDRYDAHAMLGDHYAHTGQYDLARKELRAYLLTRPTALAGNDTSVRLTLADAELRSGDIDAARRGFEAVLTAQPRNVRAQLGLAWAAAARDCVAAAPLLDALLPAAARHPEVLVVKGRCALRLGRADEARALADRYLRMRQDAAGHALRGEALLAAGDVRGARASLGEAVRMAPAEPLHALRLARVERVAGDPASAVRRLRALAPPAAIHRDYHVELGEALYAIGDDSDVVDLCEPAIERHPRDATLRALVGLALYRRGDARAAATHLAKALELDPTSARARAAYLDALNTMAGIAVRENDLAAAERHLTRALGVDVTHLLTARNLGAIRLALGQGPAAAAVLAPAAARHPRDAVVLTLLGRAHAAAKRFEDARRAFDAALALLPADPRSADVLLEATATDLEAGDPVRAFQRLEPLAGAAGAARHLAGSRARLEAALITSARAAAERHLHAGAFGQAQRTLERVERIAKGAEGVAVRCELALAATAAGDRDAADRRLRELDRPGTRCPFPSPADELTIPILAAVNSASDATHVERALGRLSGIARRATGPAERLLADAMRWLAVRAAAESHAGGQLDRARRWIAAAAAVRTPVPSPELAHDQAVLLLEAGNVDEAIAAFQRVASDIPEAHIGLGIAYDRKREPLKALESYQRALDKGARFPKLKDWIAAKRRVFGVSP